MFNPATFYFFIEVPVQSQESGWSCINLLGISILSLSMILILDFVTIPTVAFFDFVTIPTVAFFDFVTIPTVAFF